MELETAYRKRNELDDIAEKMCERWFLEMFAGEVLFPGASGKSITVKSWTAGLSTFGGQTWTRDESRPVEIDYYVLSIVFQSAYTMGQRGGHVSSHAIKAAALSQMPDHLSCPPWCATLDFLRIRA